MTDRDGDSRMRNQDDSFSEHSSRSSSMFPQEGTSTPPLSQQPQGDEKEDTLMMEDVNADASGTTQTSTNAAGQGSEGDENAPGYAWRNRRAIEEYDKSSEAVLDPDFNLQAFGDPVLDQLKEREPGFDPYAIVGQSANGK